MLRLSSRLAVIPLLLTVLCEQSTAWVGLGLARPCVTGSFGSRIQNWHLRPEELPPRPSFLPPSSPVASASATSGSEATTSSPAGVPITSPATNPPPYPAVAVRQGFSDFRSDTVTLPTQQMRKAMSKAEVGDDVFREDPTVDQLEREVASILGHEAALFVPSRTMGNLISIMIWCSARGSSFICGEKSHVFLCEEGGAAQFGGVSPFPVPHSEADGSLSLESLRKAIVEESSDASLAQLITLENPVDRCGGRVLSTTYLESVAALAHEHGLKLHLDGSRIWNAAVAAGVDVKEMTKHADSVTVCMSKGLGAPAGSLLVGSRAFTEKARKLRKALGGAMRQVGVLAAAGLVALKRTLPRLAEDHENAKRLAKGLSTLPGLKVNVEAVETNIVMIDFEDRLPLSPPELLEELERRNVLALAVGPRRIRMVTHYDVSEGDIKKAITVFEKVLQPYKELFLNPPPPAAAAAAAAVEAAASAQVAAAAARAAAAVAVSQQQTGNVSLEGGAPGVIDTTATVVVNNTLPGPTGAGSAAAGPVSQAEETLVDVVVQGVSTSARGFVVVLAEKEGEGQEGSEGGSPRKALKVVVTPSDPMSAGLDVHAAETPEAITLLQLLQDIDVGSYLKHDALSSLVGVRAGHPVSLKRVVIEQLSAGRGAGGNNSNKRFKARLEVEVGDMEGASSSANEQALKEEERGGNSSAVSAPGGAIGDSVPPTGSAAPTRVVEPEVKSSFQAMALAFRYNARMAVVSNILEDPLVAIDFGDLRGILPDLLELKPGGMKASPTTVASALDLDAEYEITRLEKQLQAALAAGDQEAVVAKLRKQLALYAPDLQDLAGLEKGLPLLDSATPSFYANAAQGGVPEGEGNQSVETRHQQQQRQQQQQQQVPKRGNNKKVAMSPPYIPPPPLDLIDST
ncbi:hypothetical protein NSK_006059 [Nannochloropsis salina CCMP1776]|uniref:Aromatic amino acid beta-eliminating lyase/threonine aldolase domain-containing protein n=1 Tax=Nannochloropsis salina CCMP1776 TaxID=1027361 RepID=A0A4D9CZ25_9STRA|nr:hypothetical protein NSK_006059 [Nannochloropsis salina CCMP1776]|eukprot:TFJ82635.1 hypothetical protein NSK_006059 [Nannochloropsis salina CCMP1776]